MKEILEIIQVKKQEFANLPLFQFMQDKGINPRQRLSFAPCMAHFIMSFSDLNKYVFRDYAHYSHDQIQHMVNEHTQEDESHSSWFSIDLEKLELNHQWNFAKTINFIWSDETKITRQISYQIAGLTLQAEPVIKLVAIEALEAMGNTFFSVSSKITRELKTITGKEYMYFGESHLEVETGHTMNESDIEKYFTDIQLTQLQYEQAIDTVEKIFDIFSEWTYELLDYAHNHPVELIQYELESSTSKLAIYR
ncbi:hypothetical protein [Calothrix sp. PCC 6303]|uniref:hypothetical protein n=1 Tax=Calothrix sp. PCC 6303 TaxID=1170562 RepID=UPI0002A0278C|nr:hypothetical protein [Calothrix sp. PCC 6303]AFY99542.1 hypothetical protein Cal6303_0465 [Calothrix sp. PCC 6303]